MGVGVVVGGWGTERSGTRALWDLECPDGERFRGSVERAEAHGSELGGFQRLGRGNNGVRGDSAVSVCGVLDFKKQEIEKNESRLFGMRITMNWKCGGDV